MEAGFRMNCSVEPCQLDIEVLPKGTSCSLSPGHVLISARSLLLGFWYKVSAAL